MEDAESDRETKLIDLIRDKRYLYDKRDENYKNKIKKRTAWEVIALEVNCSVHDCEHMWKNLRSQYWAHRRKLKSPSGSGSSTRPYFRHEEAMQFLGDANVEERTYSNVPDDVTTQTEEFENEQRSFDEDNGSPTTNTAATPPSILSKNKKRKLDSFDEELLQLLKSDSIDEFGQFGNLIATKLRKLNAKNPHLASEAQAEALIIIHSFEMKM